jgi:cytochrome c oxidase subunit 3
MIPAALDVSELPQSALNHRSTVWWGNTLLLVIETTMFALLVASYFYVRMNYPEWPPPLTKGIVTISHPVPPLPAPTFSLAVLVLSLLPAIVCDLGALAMDERRVRRALVGLLLLSLATIALRCGEFPALQFSWDDNAYASVIWTIVCLHLVHMVIAAAEILAMLLWSACHPLDRKHARDVRLTASYWYWIVGLWIPLYALIYLGPRLR